MVSDGKCLFAKSRLHQASLLGREVPYLHSRTAGLHMWRPVAVDVAVASAPMIADTPLRRRKHDPF